MFVQDLEDDIDRWAKRLAAELLRGDPIDVDQIDRERRELIARKDLLKQPRLAEKRFTEALHKKGVT